MILYYSLFGNTYKMAKAVEKGVKNKDGIPILRRVPELIPDEIIEKDERMRKAKEEQKDVKIATLSEFEEIDGIIVGSPTRFGNMCSQMKNFLDQTGKLWEKGVLIGKPAGFFCSTSTLHGGNETTLISMMFTFLHHGAIIVGIPYSVSEIIITKRGGSPYGASCVVGPESKESPTEMDLKIAEKLGERVTEIAKKLKRGGEI